jgi:cytochrome P450 family 6
MLSFRQFFNIIQQLIFTGFSMALLTNSWLADSITLLLGFVTIFAAWIKWSHTYWQRKGLFTPPTTFFFGNGKTIFTQEQSFGDFTLDIYRYFKSHHKPHGGFYLLFMPAYMPVDPELVKHVMQNDFNHFVDRGFYYNEETDPLSAHLFSLDGAKWRNLRVKMTPTFTSGKMKMMFDTLVKCGDQLVIEMNKTIGSTSIDIKDILARFTTDIIGTVAFGIDCNSLENPDNEFNRYMKQFFLDGFWENLIFL